MLAGLDAVPEELKHVHHWLLSCSSRIGVSPHGAPFTLLIYTSVAAFTFSRNLPGSKSVHCNCAH